MSEKTSTSLMQTHKDLIDACLSKVFGKYDMDYAHSRLLDIVQEDCQVRIDIDVDSLGCNYIKWTQFSGLFMEEYTSITGQINSIFVQMC